jgi:hypothetical protein
MHNLLQQCLITSLQTAPRRQINRAALTLTPLQQKRQPLKTPQVCMPIAGTLQHCQCFLQPSCLPLLAQHL